MSVSRISDDIRIEAYGTVDELNSNLGLLISLLPKGFDEHPEANYPLMIFHGHFPSDFGGFRTTPPDENLEPEQGWSQEVGLLLKKKAWSFSAQFYRQKTESNSP